jgi:hypothetical protein
MHNAIVVEVDAKRRVIATSVNRFCTLSRVADLPMSSIVETQRAAGVRVGARLGDRRDDCVSTLVVDHFQLAIIANVNQFQ